MVGAGGFGPPTSAVCFSTHPIALSCSVSHPLAYFLPTLQTRATAVTQATHIDQKPLFRPLWTELRPCPVRDDQGFRCPQAVGAAVDQRLSRMRLRIDPDEPMITNQGGGVRLPGPLVGIAL